MCLAGFFDFAQAGSDLGGTLTVTAIFTGLVGDAVVSRKSWADILPAARAAEGAHQFLRNTPADLSPRAWRGRTVGARARAGRSAPV